MPNPQVPPAGRNRQPLQPTRLPPPARQPSSASDRRPGEPPPPVRADQPTRRVVGGGSPRASRGAPTSGRRQFYRSQRPAAQQPAAAQPVATPQPPAGAHGMAQIFSMIQDAVSKIQDLGAQVGERMLRALDTIGTRV